jgi:hypothetical protein
MQAGYGGRLWGPALTLEFISLVHRSPLALLPHFLHMCLLTIYFWMNLRGAICLLKWRLAYIDVGEPPELRTGHERRTIRIAIVLAL